MLERYKKNLKVIGGDVYSYGTKVGIIDRKRRELKVLGYWSRTTSKHLNYVGKELGLKQIIEEGGDVRIIIM